MFSAVDDIERLLMNLPANAILVISGGRDQIIQRLHSRITADFGHDIKKLRFGWVCSLSKTTPWVLKPCNWKP